ncbi:ABC transporter ATP-binding protein [Natrialba taiwanensis]|uniref:ABC-type branched-chain amino acid transport system, ATPase component n=1 Tax=Natrialba taiwanensis DSM 12281 TaxID=1230458 RepID=M0ADL1_9EURY|nr:ABC transporter ATP-binding protein [Natrialba taiwanensis]ELY96845.1 ABC-type branched-chain amino acid transport system, ATPase component [Natrialba taiwanensis DSM 12281]
MTLLKVDRVDVSYGDLQVLWDVSMAIAEEDSVVTLVGPNGAGKTTLLRTLSGLLEPSAGTIEILGSDISTRRAEEIVDLGLVHVPEERNLFDEMTVAENLRMGSYRHRDEFEETHAEVVEMFPVLEERREQKAGTLSGGEQQMLAIGRGLMAQPDILALDEPSGALAPQLAERVFEKIEEISTDVTVLLVEQHVDRALELADRAYLLENGRIAAEGTGTELLESDHVVEAYLHG